MTSYVVGPYVATSIIDDFCTLNGFSLKSSVPTSVGTCNYYKINEEEAVIFKLKFPYLYMRKYEEV